MHNYLKKYTSQHSRYVIYTPGVFVVVNYCLLSLCYFTIFTCILYYFYYNQQMHSYLIKVYITTVSLCNLLG